MEKPIWMDDSVFAHYMEITKEKARLLQEHERLKPRLADRTATQEEWKQVREGNLLLEYLHAEQKRIELFNPMHPQHFTEEGRNRPPILMNYAVGAESSVGYAVFLGAIKRLLSPAEFARIGFPRVRSEKEARAIPACIGGMQLAANESVSKYEKMAEQAAEQIRNAQVVRGRDI